MEPGRSSELADRVTGAVLAGGQSSRFGSDKALALLPGTDRTFLEQICRTVAEVATNVLVVGRTEAPGCPAATALPDREPGCGPAGGVLTALEYASTPMLVVISCDQPLVTSGDLRRLILACRSVDAAVFASPVRGFHPLPCAIRASSAVDLLKNGVDLEGSSLRKLIEMIGPETVPPGEAAERLIDIDTPDDLEGLRSRQLMATDED